MGKRTGNPRGRPSKRDSTLILSVRNRPQGQSVEEFCERNARTLGGDLDKMGADLAKRYHRIVGEYPPDEVFDLPSRWPGVTVKARALFGSAALWPRKPKGSKGG